MDLIELIQIYKRKRNNTALDLANIRKFATKECQKKKKALGIFPYLKICYRALQNC